MAQPGFGGGGTGGLGNGSPPAGSRGRATGGWFGGGIASRKLIAVCRIFGCQTMHNFVYLAQRRSQEFSCEPNFGGGLDVDLASPVLTDA